MYNKIIKIPPIKYTTDELKQVLTKANLSGWNVGTNVKDGASIIEKEYKLKSFEQTWSFLNQISMRSHLLGHHPSILTTYNQVKITLTTHDVNGISDVDIKLAKQIEKYRKLYE